MTGNFDSNFNGYRLIEPVGDVKGCNVFKGVAAAENEIVAIKIFPAEITRNRRVLERLRNSFKTIARLNHPSILPIMRFSVQGGRPTIIMPFMDAGSLKDRIKYGALAAIDVEVAIRDLASALDTAHSHGLVHGNLKPSYILFDDRGHVLLNGIGEAPIRRNQARLPRAAEDGAFDYRAPEVKAGGEITPLADQYSLGLIALQMLTCLPIEEAMSALEFCQSQDADHITRPSKLILDLPKRVIAVLLQALSKDPSQRFPSIGIMQQAFEAALHNEDFRLEPETDPEPKSELQIPVKRRRSRLAVLAPILALVLCLVVAIPALSSKGDGPLSGLLSVLGLNQDGNAAEVMSSDGETVGGIALPTEDSGEKTEFVDDVSTKTTDTSPTSQTSEPVGGSVDSPDNTAVPPAKTEPPKEPAATQASSDQPTATYTPTITETGTITATPTITDSSLTDIPEEATINPKACSMDDPKRGNYCTPTPTPSP